MGNSESKERQLFKGVILQLLTKRGIKVKKSNIHSFFSFVQEQCPWFPEEGTVNLDTWERVGKQLKTYHAEHGSEKVPTDAFSLWNIIRDALDPAPESEKVHLKEESADKKVSIEEESDEKEATPSYRQLNQMIAAMTAQEKVIDRDDKKEQVSDEEDLEKEVSQDHSDEDWSLLNKDAPRSLRETSPIRLSAPKSLIKTSPTRPPASRNSREISLIKPSASRGSRQMSPIRIYAPESLRQTSPGKTSVRPKHKTDKKFPKYEESDIGHPLPPPPYKGEGPPLEAPRRRVFSSPDDELDPHLEACFPIIFGGSGGRTAPHWEPIPMKMIKELKQACALYGPKAPYTVSLVEALAGRWMTPHDWKTVAKACLSGGQYVLWRTEYEDLAQKQADANQKYGPRYIIKSMLAGTNDFGTLRDQMGLDKTTLDQVTACALGAWRLLPEGKESTSSFSNVKQKPEEPYEDFISRLAEAVNRVISNTEAASILIKQLAFENANSTCQAILRPIKKTGEIIDYIRQCADVGPAMMQGVAIAAAIKGNSYQQAVQSFFTNKNNPSKSHSSSPGQNIGLSKACFSCGREGHFMRACPQKATGSSLPNSVHTNLPRSLCPRCQKGYHWAKECRSQFHRNGAFLGPDQQSGNGLRGQPQAPTTIGAASLNPFIPFVPSQNSSEQPQAAQDWTSVPPPQQY